MKSYPQKLGLTGPNNPLLGCFFQKEVFFIIVFFCLCLAGVLLGDGKQAVVDVFIAGGVVCLLGLLLFRAISTKTLPWLVYWSWMALLAYTGTRTLFSDSVGASLYVFFRIVVGFLVFWMFFSVSSQRIIAIFERIFLFFVGTCTVVFLYYLVFPPTLGDTTLMSLVYHNYGHNHFSVLLVFILPLLIKKGPSEHKSLNKVFWVIYFFVLVFMFSRGALVVVSLYLLWEARQRMFDKKKKAWIFFSIATFLLGVFFIQSFSRQWINKEAIEKTPLWVQRYVFKPTFSQEGRFEYARQAWVAITERPFFGSGPGTFDLLSRRLQNETRQFSWFTHNAPLQVLAEVGVVGGIFFLLLIVVIFQHIKTPRLSPLFVGVCLIGVMGLVDFVWDFYVVQLLGIAILGLFVGVSTEHAKKGKLKMTYLFIVLVFLYYISGFSSILIKSALNNDTLVFYVSPYNKRYAKNYLQNKELSSISQNSTLLQFMFQKDSDILVELFDTTPPHTREIYQQSIILDPYNKKLLKDYVAYLSGVPFELVLANKNTILPFLAVYSSENPNPQRSVGVYEFPLSEDLWRLLLLAEDPKVGVSKIYYLAAQLVNSQETEKYLQISRDTAPQWGYYWIELASYQKNVLNNYEAAKKTLDLCNNQQYAQDLCKQYSFDSLPQFGFFHDDIYAISK